VVGNNLNLQEKLAELARLREEFLQLFNKYEDISKENFALFNRYNLLFGEKYYERYLLFCEAERLRRKIELYQFFINRGEEIDKGYVETVLDAEFRELEERLEVLLEENQAAREFEKLPFLTQEETRDLERIYLKIAERIHPDLTPDFDERKKELWIKTLNAYKLNDLETLKECEAQLDKCLEGKPRRPDYEKLDEEIEAFKAKNSLLRERNRKLMQSFPYNHKNLLDDPEWIKDKLKELDRDIELFRRSLELLRERLQEIDPSYEKEIC